MMGLALVSAFGLTSCGLLQSAVKVPASILQAVGRTAGMNVSHQEEPQLKPEIDVAEGHIDQLD